MSEICVPYARVSGETLGPHPSALGFRSLLGDPRPEQVFAPTLLTSVTPCDSQRLS